MDEVWSVVVGVVVGSVLSTGGQLVLANRQEQAAQKAEARAQGRFDAASVASSDRDRRKGYRTIVTDFLTHHRYSVLEAMSDAPGIRVGRLSDTMYSYNCVMTGIADDQVRGRCQEIYKLTMADDSSMNEYAKLERAILLRMDELGWPV